MALLCVAAEAIASVEQRQRGGSVAGTPAAPSAVTPATTLGPSGADAAAAATASDAGTPVVGETYLECKKTSPLISMVLGRAPPVARCRISPNFLADMPRIRLV